MIPKKFEPRINKGVVWYYTITAVLDIKQVDLVRRRVLLKGGLKYVGMINHNNHYLLIFRQRKEQ